jgi:hypothetical protein
MCHGAGKYVDTWELWREGFRGVKGIVLWKGGDVGRRGGSGGMVAG